MEVENKNNNTRKHKNILKPIIIGYFLGIIFFILMFLWMLYPLGYNWAFGEKVVENHITELLGNETDYYVAVPILLNWLKTETHYPTKEESLWTLNNGWGLYWINGQPRFFHRGIPASWVIKSKLGRCGEDSMYFVEIMNKLGYESRRIRPDGWDHSWAEFYTPSGIKIYVDPSGFRIIEDPVEFASRSNWTAIWAENEDGSKENVSSEYMPK